MVEADPVDLIARGRANHFGVLPLQATELAGYLGIVLFQLVQLFLLVFAPLVRFPFTLYFTATHLYYYCPIFPLSSRSIEGLKGSDIF